MLVVGVNGHRQVFMLRELDADIKNLCTAVRDLRSNNCALIAMMMSGAMSGSPVRSRWSTN